MGTIIHDEQDLIKILSGKSNVVFDIEADGLLDTITKIYCLSFSEGTGVFTIYDKALIEVFFRESKIIVGHNIIVYDLPAIEKIYNIVYKGDIVDTMALSWYLNTVPGSQHGLEYYGELYGYPKKEIEDWKNLTLGEYIERCERDVEINYLLFRDQMEYLNQIYEGGGDLSKLIRYLGFKMKCLKHQEDNPLKVDTIRVLNTIEKLESLKQPMIDSLFEAMPKVEKISKRNKPKVMYKKDGSLSVAGEKWVKIIEEHRLPEDFEGPVDVVTGYEDPNPNSHSQVKDWLFSLGWKPCTFEYKENSKGESNAVPQIRKEGEIVESVAKLAVKEPAINALGEIGILGHRISFLEGILKNVDDNGYLTASAFGFTNTLRFRHRNFVNVPGVNAPYGRDIRDCFIAEEGREVVGADVKNLESQTMMSYIYPFDPDYVKDMQTEGYDAHLEIAMLAGMLTQEQVNAHKEGKEDYSVERHAAKQANFSATYKIGATSLARALGKPKKFAEELLKTFWKRNWAIKAVEESVTWKKIGEQMWLLNPVSDMWYPLRYEKDIFSTLNQGTGVYCFDMWVAHIMKLGAIINAQMHDEIISNCDKEEKENYKNILNKGMDKTNKSLGLNVELAIDIQFGETYAEVH